MGTIEHLFIHWHMQGMPKRKTTIMDMLDPFIEIILDGIRAKEENAGLTLHLKLEAARVFGELLQTKEILKKRLKAPRRLLRQEKHINKKDINRKEYHHENQERLH